MLIFSVFFRRYAAEYRVVPGTSSMVPFLTSLCSIPFILFSEPIEHISLAVLFLNGLEPAAK